MEKNCITVKLDEFASYDDIWGGFYCRAPNKQALLRLKEIFGRRKPEVSFCLDGSDLVFVVDASEDKPLEALVFRNDKAIKLYRLEHEKESAEFFAYMQQQGWNI